MAETREAKNSLADVRDRSQPAMISPETFDGVAFDLDGVLTKTALVHQAAWKRIFDDYLERRAEGDQHGFTPFSSDDYRQYVDGRPRADGIRVFLKSRGIVLPEGDPNEGPDRDTVQGLSLRKNRIFLELLEHQGVETYPHVRSLIGRLRQVGLRTAVVTASKNCTTVLRAAGIADLFDATFDGHDREALSLKGKPAPDTFLAAARRLGIEPSTPERAVSDNVIV